MRWLSTANFLRGSWLSSHTSFSGVNKCLVQGWVRGIWQLLLLKPSFWCGEEKGTVKIKKRREGGRRKHINQEGHWNSPCCIMWWSSRGNANYKWGHPVICRWLVWCGFFSTLWCFLAPNFCGMTAITLTGSALLLCPISFTIKLSEKHEPIINYWRGKNRASTRCHSVLQRKLTQITNSISLTTGKKLWW